MKIQHEGFLRSMRKASLCAGLGALGLLLSPGYGIAQTITLSNGGSIATVNMTPGAGAGMNSWTVDTAPDQNQLALQWFYYSINGGPVQAIDQAGTLYDTQSDSSSLNVDYFNSQVEFGVSYTLQGGGSGSGNADIMEGLTIDNLSGTAFNLQFYQFSHFTLLGDPNSVFVSTDPNNSSAYNYAEQYVGATALAEGIIAPDANYAEAGAPRRFSVISKAEITSPTILRLPAMWRGHSSGTQLLPGVENLT